MPLSRLETRHLAAFRKLHPLSHCAKYRPFNDEGKRTRYYLRRLALHRLELCCVSLVMNFFIFSVSRCSHRIHGCLVRLQLSVHHFVHHRVRHEVVVIRTQSLFQGETQALKSGEE